MSSVCCLLRILGSVSRNYPHPHVDLTGDRKKKAERESIKKNICVQSLVRALKRHTKCFEGGLHLRDGKDGRVNSDVVGWETVC